MNKSVKEISDQLGVNRSIVYRAIKKLSLEPENTENGSKTALYGEESIKVIKDEIKRIQAKKSEQRPPERVTQTATNDELADALRETIRIQSETIDHLRAENDELREMIKREQDLRAGLLALEVKTQDRPKLTERIKARFTRKPKEQN